MRTLANWGCLIRDAPFSLVRSSVAVPQSVLLLRYMRGLFRVLQGVTISLLGRVRQFTPLQGGPAFFLPLFTQPRRRGILRPSPVSGSRGFAPGFGKWHHALRWKGLARL
jgi:hypothetical protein